VCFAISLDRKAPRGAINRLQIIGAGIGCIPLRKRRKVGLELRGIRRPGHQHATSILASLVPLLGPTRQLRGSSIISHPIVLGYIRESES
jgi:hypothetical protein